MTSLCDVPQTDLENAILDNVDMMFNHIVREGKTKVDDKDINYCIEEIVDDLKLGDVSPQEIAILKNGVKIAMIGFRKYAKKVISLGGIIG